MAEKRPMEIVFFFPRPNFHILHILILHTLCWWGNKIPSTPNNCLRNTCIFEQNYFVMLLHLKEILGSVNKLYFMRKTVKTCINEQRHLIVNTNWIFLHIWTQVLYVSKYFRIQGKYLHPWTKILYNWYFRTH